MYNPNHPATLISAICINAIATLWYFLLPLYAGALANYLHYSAENIGWLATIELLGYAFASASAFFWVRRFAWLHIVQVATFAILMINGLCLFFQSFDALILLRFLSGWAGGMLLATTYSLLADSDKPERNFGFVIAAQTVLAVLALLILPTIITLIGINGIFVVIFIVTMSILPMARYFPRVAITLNPTPPGENQFSLSALLVLVALAVYMTGQTGVWVYVERLGVAATLAQNSIEFILAISLLISLIGSLLAVWVADRWGNLLPFLLFVIAQGIALWLFLDLSTQFQYFLAIGIFQVGWTFITPYFMAILVTVDKNGRYISLLVFASAAGALFGPVLAGHFISEENYNPVLLISAVCTVLSVIIIAPYFTAFSPIKRHQS